MQISFLNKNFKTILLFTILILVFYRSPHIFLNGRFVGEEGSFWFRNSYLFGPIVGLTQVFWGSGYFNLWANISSVIASFVPLNYSPLVTVYFAFAVQLYLFIFIIFSKSDFIITNIDKILISLIVLLSPCMVAEVWLNTLTSQVYFTILTILIYFQKDISNSIFNKLSPIIVLISGLSSILPCVLSPFFIYKYFNNKIKLNLYNLFAIVIATIFQSIIYLYAKINNLELVAENTRYILSFEKVTNFTYNVLIKSFFGRDLTQIIYYKFLSSFNLYALSLLIIILFLFFFILVIKKIKIDKILFFLILFFLFNVSLAIFASKMEQVQGRYALIPGVILIFIVYRYYQISSGIPKNLSILLIVISLLAGSYEYKHNHVYPHYLICNNCPDWKEEVSKWKKDNNYSLKIWMYPTKTMKLDK